MKIVTPPDDDRPPLRGAFHRKKMLWLAIFIALSLLVFLLKMPRRLAKARKVQSMQQKREQSDTNRQPVPGTPNEERDASHEDEPPR